MIRYLDVVPKLRAACPSFDASHEAAFMEPEAGEFVHVGHFVAHLVVLSGEGRSESLSAVFEVVERVLVEGDLEARSLVVAGFLDDLTNLDFYRFGHQGPIGFEPWFRPYTRRVPSVAALLEECT
jgi:hypothetical protein